MDNYSNMDIRPNVGKNFGIDVIVVLALVSVSLVFLYFLNSVVGLDAYTQIFEFIGINIEQSALITISIIAIVIVSLVTLLYDYIVLSNIRYEFMDDYLIYRKNISLVFNQEIKIPYSNIIRISYLEEGFFNKIFNTGPILIELSGMKQREIKLEAIDYAQKTAQMIHNMINEYRIKQYARINQQHRFNQILDQKH